jgi:hypothetical protein
MTKRGAQSFKTQLMMLLVAASGWTSRGLAAPLPAAPSDLPPPKSIFIMPAKPAEGRDPFFPDSIRPYEEAQAANEKNVPTINDLVVHTILVNAHGEAFAIINDQTFGVGDEGDVITSSGKRIHIHCVGIDSAKGNVTVESGDATVTLTYSSNQ